MQVNRVFAGDDVSDGAAGGLAGGLLAALGWHFCEGRRVVSGVRVERSRCMSQWGT